MSSGWVAGLNGNITNSAPNWVGLGLWLTLAIKRSSRDKAACLESDEFHQKKYLSLNFSKEYQRLYAALAD